MSLFGLIPARFQPEGPETRLSAMMVSTLRTPAEYALAESLCFREYEDEPQQLENTRRPGERWGARRVLGTPSYALHAHTDAFNIRGKRIRRLE